jgi:hypothetical protein
MTALGWLFLTVSCGAVTAAVVCCFWRVLRLPRASEEIHAPLDIDTGDLDEEP